MDVHSILEHSFTNYARWWEWLLIMIINLRWLPLNNVADKLSIWEGSTEPSFQRRACFEAVSNWRGEVHCMQALWGCEYLPISIVVQILNAYLENLNVKLFVHRSTMRNILDASNASTMEIFSLAMTTIGNSKFEYQVWCWGIQGKVARSIEEITLTENLEILNYHTH